MTFLLCDPGWYVHKPHVQNKWGEHIHTHTVITRRIYRRYAGFGPSCVRTMIPSTRRLGQGCCFAQFYASVCDNNFPSLVASLFSWRCLAASTSSFLHATTNLRLPSVTVSTHTSVFEAFVFQSPAMPNARMSFYTQSVHSFSFPPRPLRTAPSRFSKTIRFGSRPPLIWMSVPAHKSLLVRNVVSMLSHPVISRAANNPARGRLNRENEHFRVPVRA